MKRKVIGVDFGSSQCSISVMNIGTIDLPELLNVTGQKNGFTVPTVLALDANDNSLLAFGNEVYTNYRQTGNSNDVKFVYDFKRKLGSSEEYDDYCQLFINELAKLVKKHFNIQTLDSEDYVTCFAYPASWEGTDKVNKLKLLAEKAGFPDVRCMTEPVAAMHTLRVVNKFKFSDKPENHMVIDFGGGTLDICIIRTDVLGRTPEIIGKSGDPELGGTEFDVIIETLFFRNNDSLSKKDLSIRELADLHEKIKEAKNTLSEKWLKDDFATYDFNLLCGTYTLALSKQEFYQKCKDQGIFDKITKCIRGALAQSKLDISDISEVILTGGSSKWFFMREIVAKEFKLSGDEIYLTQKPFTDVANGCAINIGWIAAPLENPGLWIKYKIGDTKQEWSTPKCILEPNSSKEFDKIRVPITELCGTKYWSSYLVSVVFLERTDENNYKEIGQAAFVEFPAKSNMPFIRRLTRIIDAVRGNKLNELIDKYYLYFVYYGNKNEFSNNSHYSLELLDDNEYKWQQVCVNEGIDSANKLSHGKRIEAPLIGGFKCKFNLLGQKLLTPYNMQ